MIIDTHTHFYDPTRPQGVPWPDPNDEVLYRVTLPDRLKPLAEPLGVTGTVVVEASPWLDDNTWILDLAENEPFIVGFVGNLNPDDAAFETHLDRFAANPLFRGIRLRPFQTGEIDANGYVAKMEALAARDLALDLLAQPSELRAVARLAEAVPTLRIVLDHVAHVPIDGGAPSAEWRDGMEAVSRSPHVYCKVSGLVEAAQDRPTPTALDYYRPTLDVLWDLFGEDRLFFGSNWPVSERFASYETVFRIAEAYIERKGGEASEKFFTSNSKAVYRWLDRMDER